MSQFSKRFAPNLSGIFRRLALAASLVVAGVFGANAFAQPRAIDRLVFFGGSLSDTGNSFIFLTQAAGQDCGNRLNTPPYDSLEDVPVPDGPYARGGHHYSNGATWAEVLARDLALAGNARPALRNAGQKASNYAAGGARAVQFPCRFNLPEQVQAYLAASAQTSSETVIAIEIGGNDVRDALFALATGGNPSPFIQNALASLTNNIAALYASGARRFLILNMPNLARAPAVRALGQGAMAAAQELSSVFNAGLGQVVAFANGLGGAEARVLDLYALLEQVVSSPATYGFENVVDACITPKVPPFQCRQPESYVFWDGIHPTHAMHVLIAHRAMAVLSAP